MFSRDDTAVLICTQLACVYMINSDGSAGFGDDGGLLFIDEYIFGRNYKRLMACNVM